MRNTGTAPVASTRSPAKGAAIIAGIYFVVGAAWILFSDRAVHALRLDPALAERVQTVKGWGFVLVTAGLLFLLVRRRLGVEHAALTTLAETRAIHQTLVENLPGMVLRCRADGARTIEFASDGCERILGAAPEAAANRSLFDFLHPEDGDDVRGELRTAFESGRPFHLVYRIRPEEEEEEVRWVEEFGRRVNGTTESFVMDVTDRHGLEAALNESQKMEAIGRLAAGVAHDFNNMLTVIMGYTQVMLGRDAGDEKRREHLERVMGAARDAQSITKQLLLFARRPSAEDRTLVSLNVVVANLGRLLEKLVGEEVEVRAGLAPDLGGAEVFPGHVEQILLNLAVNARDAMPDGGTLTVETENVDLDARAASALVLKPPAGRYVALCVSDTGVGMDRATRERIFEPLFTTKPKGVGTGLGLTTVYAILKQYGGGIWVYSQEAHGTTFRVYLPRADEEGARLPEMPEPEIVGGTERILVVDDEPLVREVACALLEEYGYRTASCSDAEAALAAFRARPEGFDLLLTDVMMPGRTGPALARECRTLRPGLPVLFMSGYSDQTLAERGLIEEGEEAIEKPFVLGTLVSRVRETLDR